MRLQELRIQNFRKVKDIKLQFPPGLCVIVGENNAGKTTIIDALRLILFSGRDFDSLRISENDFREGTDYAPIEISCRFCELSDEDEAHFKECLVSIENSENFYIQLNTFIMFKKDTGRISFKMWGGETEGGSLPSNLYERISSIYLQPLRDPERGLRPGQNSQISRLVNCLTDEQKIEEFEEITHEANSKIRQLESVKNATKDINLQIGSIAGQELSQQTELIFSAPSFRRIIAGLQPEVDGLPCTLNGLGYNNLIFTAATLGTLRRDSKVLFRSILVEEPEAHLHPQLQVLLLRRLEEVSSKDIDNPIQVIASSHSPILVSQAPLDSIILIYDHDQEVNAVSLCTLDIDLKIKKKLERFLDATRGELFFARRLLMVEGIAETLLLPILAKIAGGDLKDSSVTLLNANGINFNAFLPLFESKGFKFPVAILTDGDASVIGADISSTAVNLKDRGEDITNLCVECSEITFEHELARSPKFLPVMLEAFEDLRPQLGKKLKIEIQKLRGRDVKANAFLKKFLESKTSKGEFAQELAALLMETKLSRNDVPEYIRRTLEFLQVIS